MKTIATLLLVLMALVLALCEYFKGLFPWLRFVGAFAEAALIGGFADWFAVTALFRRPLGLPIPHTAIIPANKDRIADSLGEFVYSNFLNEEILARKLKELNVSARLTSWLDDDKNIDTLLNVTLNSLPRFFKSLNSEALQSLFKMKIEEALRALPIAAFAGNVIEQAISSDKNHELTAEMLKFLEETLAQHDSSLKEMIGRGLPWYVPRFLHDKVYRDFIANLKAGLQEMNLDPQHTGRKKLLAALSKLASELQSSPQWKTRGDKLINRLIDNPALQSFIQEFWNKVRTKIVLSAESDNSPLRMAFRRLFETLREALKGDLQIQNTINEHLAKLAVSFAQHRREWIVSLISGTMRNWDSRTLVEKIEQNIGNDLQYIRLNGMIVGGCVGLLFFVVAGR